MLKEGFPYRNFVKQWRVPKVEMVQSAAWLQNKNDTTRGWKHQQDAETFDVTWHYISWLHHPLLEGWSNYRVLTCCIQRLIIKSVLLTLKTNKGLFYATQKIHRQWMSRIHNGIAIKTLTIFISRNVKENIPISPKSRKYTNNPQSNDT